MFMDYDDIEFIDEANLARECINDIFHQGTPGKTIIELLFSTDFITMGIYSDARKDVNEYINDVREKLFQTELNQ